MKVISTVFTACLLAALSLPAQAQTPKLGHLNYQAVLEVMPGFKDAEKKVQDMVIQLQKQLEAMQGELNRKVDEYTRTKDSLPDAIATVIIQEIKDLEARILQLQYSSEETVMKKQVEVLKPLEDQMLAAIKSVAAEKGYSYIFDSGPRTSLLHFPPADDITGLVKAKVGIP